MVWYFAMNELEKIRLKMGNLVFEYWRLLPENKISYTKYYQGVDQALEQALDAWHLSDREKRIREVENDRNS